jgi:hypothetical protein
MFKFKTFITICSILVSALSVSLYIANDNNCSLYIVDRLQSPNRKLSIVRAEKRCNNDETSRPLMFALLRSGEKFSSQRVFLTSKSDDGINDPLSIFPKWIDDNNLLIVAPEGNTLKTIWNEFGGIHIKYEYYPADSNKVNDIQKIQYVKKKSHFESKFSIDHGYGTPGVGCHLTITSHDGQDLDELEINLTARKTFSVKSLKPPKYKVAVVENAYSSYYFQIDARDKVDRPDKHVTGANIIGFSSKDGELLSQTVNFNYPHTKTPSGKPMPKWEFSFIPKDPHDIVSIANMIKTGNIMLQLSYWQDNKIVIYSSTKLNNSKPIEIFEQCIEENHIFETSPLTTKSV